MVLGAKSRLMVKLTQKADPNQTPRSRHNKQCSLNLCAGSEKTLPRQTWLFPLTCWCQGHTPTMMGENSLTHFTHPTYPRGLCPCLLLWRAASEHPSDSQRGTVTQRMIRNNFSCVSLMSSWGQESHIFHFRLSSTGPQYTFITVGRRLWVTHRGNVFTGKDKKTEWFNL